MKWQPIETAPKDGTIVLTNDGTAQFVNSPRATEGWVACSSGDEVYSCADWGPFHVEPTHWMPLPEPPKENE